MSQKSKRVPQFERIKKRNNSRDMSMAKNAFLAKQMENDERMAVETLTGSMRSTQQAIKEK